MFEILLGLVGTPFGIGGIVAAGAAAAAAFLLPARGLQVASALAVVAVTLAGAGYVDRLRTDLASAQAGIALEKERSASLEDRAIQAEATARHNEAAALALGRQLTDQADTFDRFERQASSDADRYTAALEAARAARCQASVPAPVYQALQGKVTPEDAPLPESFKAVERELRRGRRR